MRRDTNTKTTAATTPNRKTAFQTERLTENTFLITEVDDIYDERPQIFVKRLANNCKLLVIDTGCGGATNDPDVQITGLREYLETVPLECNANEPLNASELGYIVVATHCHYDHILGIEQFADANARILVSAHSPYFISPANLPKHSLCADMGIHTPKYTPILVPHRHEIAPDVFILHTPGHTPDELAVYDATEKMLYVGDTLYEEDTIIFPNEGSIVDWTRSVEMLLALARREGTDVRINSGHKTHLRPANDVLEATLAFMEDVLAGREPVRQREQCRGEMNVVYRQDGGRFALRCPEKLVLEARK